MANFVLTTFGSLGDLHPYIAVAGGLRQRGHKVTIATSPGYRAKVEDEGLHFHPVRPDLETIGIGPEQMARAYHPRTGTEYVIRRMFLPHLEQSFDDLETIAADADLLVGHPIAFATPLVAEHLGKPWLSVALQPAAFLSAYDPPAISSLANLQACRAWGPAFWRLIFSLGKRVSRGWGAPIKELRQKLGLRQTENPILDGMFSPAGTLAWFSKVLAQPQPDWPVKTTITGFPFYDKLAPGVGLSPDLARFLDSGPPPLVFTLGSSAVMTAGRFYEESAEAARILGRRAVLLLGSDPRNAPQKPLAKGIVTAEYAPYSELFPRSAAIVHQGGAGTTAQALRAGTPMCVVPYSHDQPDNARRCAALGVARVIGRSQYRAKRVAEELDLLLANPAFQAAAKRTASAMATEDGIAAACDGLERALPPKAT